MCKPCRSSYQKQYLKRNPEKHRALVDRRKREIRDWVVAEKSVPCADCGGTFPPCVMDFDHRPGETKLFSLGDHRRRSMGQVRLEREKCDVVCANCHRIRTHIDRKKVSA